MDEELKQETSEEQTVQPETQGGTEAAAEAQAAADSAAQTAQAEAGQEDATAEEQAAPDPKDAEIAELKDQLLRSRAEFQNYKRRTQEESVKLGTFTTAMVVGKFLKVLDNFERAEQSAAKTADAAILQGLDKIRKQFEETLKQLEVEEIQALNVKFDPNFHEAVMRNESSDLPEETIDMVLEKGYKIRDHVIRTAKVRVISK